MEFLTNQCPTMKTSDSHTWSSKMPHGVGLEISHHPLSMRRVANLIIALERLRDHQRTMSPGFRDEDLLSFMLESVMEEKMVLHTEDHHDEEGVRISGFRQLGEEESARISGFEKGQGVEECSMVDCDKKHLVLMAMELQAVRLQNGNGHRQVRLNLSTYRPPSSSEPQKARPVTLAIKGTQLYLSCSKTLGKPTLRLEEVKDDLRRIPTGSDNVRFLFYRWDTGVDSSTLMSALYTGWYISTGVQNGVDQQTVDMCELQAKQRCTNFTVIN